MPEAALRSRQIGHRSLRCWIATSNLRKMLHAPLPRIGPMQWLIADCLFHRGKGVRLLNASTTVNPLTAIKLAHTVVWTFFVACILAIPLYTAKSEFGIAAFFAAVVAVEVAILMLNRMRCPLTAIAARHTDDRRSNFDIYLPEWLARNNKQIFGLLYVLALLFLLVRWLRAI